MNPREDGRSDEESKLDGKPNSNTVSLRSSFANLALLHDFFLVPLLTNPKLGVPNPLGTEETKTEDDTSTVRIPASFNAASASVTEKKPKTATRPTQTPVQVMHPYGIPTKLNALEKTKATPTMSPGPPYFRAHLAAAAAKGGTEHSVAKSKQTSRPSSSRGRGSSSGSSARQPPSHVMDLAQTTGGHQPHSGNKTNPSDSPAGTPWSPPRNSMTAQNNETQQKPLAFTHAPPKPTTPSEAVPRRRSSNSTSASGTKEDALVSRLATQNAIAIARARQPPAQIVTVRNSPGQQMKGSTSTQQPRNPVRYSPLQRKPTAGEAARQALAPVPPKAKVHQVNQQTEHSRQYGSVPMERNEDSSRHIQLVAGDSSTQSDRRGTENPPQQEHPTAATMDEAVISTLVRKLLGHDPVNGNECPILLGPDLIASLAEKIRNVILKLVNMQSNPIVTSRKRSTAGDHEVIDLSADDPEELNAKLKNITAALKEETAKVSRLQRSLAEKKSAEKAMEAAYGQNRSQAERTNASVENLVKKIEEGVVTVQRQKQEIISMRTVINQDAADLQEKDRIIEDLRKQIREQPAPDNGPPIETVLELVQLKDELKATTETLDQERRRNESTARSYMRAAIHSVKIHNRLMDKRGKKRKTKS